MKKFKSIDGVVESAFTFMLVTIISVIGSTGILFGGGNPAGSAMFIATNALTAYSTSPHVLEKFRRNKAVGYCEQGGKVLGVPTSDCKDYVASLSDVQVMDIIRDSDPGTAVQWSDMRPRLGSPKWAGGI